MSEIGGLLEKKQVTDGKIRSGGWENHPLHSNSAFFDAVRMNWAKTNLVVPWVFKGKLRPRPKISALLTETNR